MDEPQTPLPLLLAVGAGAWLVWWGLGKVGTKMQLTRKLMVTAIGGVVIGGLLYGMIYRSGS